MASEERLVELIELIVLTYLRQFTVALPGRVQAYDKAANTVDVQPEPATWDDEGNAVSHPVIPSVPLLWARGGGASITWPIKPGDRMLLVAASTALDSWRKAGGQVEPGERRYGDLSDVVALPGLYPSSEMLGALRTSLTDLIIGEPTGGQILVGEGASQAAVLGDALNLWLTTNLSVATAFGPSGPAIAGLTPAQLSAVVKVK